MKSGLEGRNNEFLAAMTWPSREVSMKSGLEGRNNIIKLPNGVGAVNASQ